MFLADFGEQSFRSVSFAIVFAVSVLLDNWFGGKGNDLLLVGMHEYGAEQLMVVGDFVGVLFLPLHAGRAMNFVGGEVLRSIDGQ